MLRPPPLPLVLLSILFSACSDDRGEEDVVIQEIIAGQDSVIHTQRDIIRAQRNQVDSLEAIVRALNRARNVATDSALAQPDIAAEAAPVARDWPASDALAYATYRNDRYGYAVEYPADIFHPDGDIGNGRGQAYASADGSALLLVFASEGGPDALRHEYEAELARFDQEVSYKVLRPNWFVVSGYQGPHVFYQRTHRSADGGLRTLRLRHLARDKDYFGPITERMSYSFEG